MKPYNNATTSIASKKIISSIIKIIFLSITELFLVCMIVFSYYLTINVDSKRVIFIPKGSTDYIITYLNKKNYSLNIIDTMVIKSIGYPQSGWIDLKSTSMTKLDFLYKLTHSKAALKSVTLIPGETYYFFLNQISKKLNISSKELFNSYFKYAFMLDGNILPQTYALPYGMKSDDVINYLFKYTNNKYKAYSKKIFGSYNQKDWYKYIIVASIIQKEAANKKEMPIVSSVIYNRLKKNMKLQMDGTLNYGKYSHTRVTSKTIKTNKTKYNTYKVNGIPSDPVCAVEFSAIKSAIFPKKTEFLYFMKSVKGNNHIFSTTYKSHKNVIDKVRKSSRFKKALSKIKKKNNAKKKKDYELLQKNKKIKNTLSTSSLWKSVY